ncbi:unnamed protein product, partial [Staurois parvus]
MTSSHSHHACAAQGVRGDRRCAVSLGHSGSPIHRKSRRCRLGHVISCVQSQLITFPPVSVHQCLVSVPISAISMPQCPSELPFSVTQSVPYVSAAFQCPSVMPVNAHQCHLSVLPHQCSLS